MSKKLTLHLCPIFPNFLCNSKEPQQPPYSSHGSKSRMIWEPHGLAGSSLSWFQGLPGMNWCMRRTHKLLKKSTESKLQNVNHLVFISSSANTTHLTTASITGSLEPSNQQIAKARKLFKVLGPRSVLQNSALRLNDLPTLQLPEVTSAALVVYLFSNVHIYLSKLCYACTVKERRGEGTHGWGNKCPPPASTSIFLIFFSKVFLQWC